MFAKVLCVRLTKKCAKEVCVRVCVCAKGVCVCEKVMVERVACEKVIFEKVACAKKVMFAKSCVCVTR